MLIANMILASYDYKTHILFLIFSLFQMLEASIRATSGFQTGSLQKMNFICSASSVHISETSLLKAGFILTGHSLCVQYSDDDDVGDKDNFCG